MRANSLSKRTFLQFLPFVFVMVASVAPAAAQGLGVRAGVSIDPDQVYIGGHYETDALVDRLHFRPNVEAGIGDDLTLLSLNFEFAYKFPSRHGWRLYAGGGPAVNFYSRDNGRDNGRDSSSEAGLNILLGVERSSGLFFEFKIGALDSPNLKFGVGWTFQ